MAEGNIIYQGAASRSESYFRKCGYPLPRYKNPADSFMKILSISFPPTPEETSRFLVLIDSYNNKQLKKVNEEIKSLSF